MRVLKPTHLVLIAALALARFAAAAENEPAPEQPEAGDQATEQESETGEPIEAMPDIGLIEEADDVAREDDENFVPSVRITEDLPVAFPVDI